MALARAAGSGGALVDEGHEQVLQPLARHKVGLKVYQDNPLAHDLQPLAHCKTRRRILQPLAQYG